MEDFCYHEMFEVEDRHWWYLSLHRLLLGVLDRLAPELHEGLVLDCGCGTGGFLRRLLAARPGLKAAAMDISPLALAGCRQKLPGQPLLAASANQLPFGDGLFDLAISLDVIYHRLVDDRLAIRELSRVLKPGGLLILNLAAFDCLAGSHDKVVHAVKRFTRPKAEALVRSGGMQPVYLTYWNTSLLPIMAARRWFFTSPESAASSDLRDIPEVVNRLLTGLFAREVDLASRRPLPLGGSLLVVARK